MFDHLDDRRFEEFTYDLLISMGFVNVSWRRGTGKQGASADQGRDIVADWLRTDVDGAKHLERWFVQCKHYTQGVPPSSFSDAVTWAEAERPAVLVIAASNFLSNPAKDWIGRYEANNRPAFQIKVWEGKDLERHASSAPALLARYVLDAVPSNVHPAHLQYVVSVNLNTLDYFFETIDALDERIRNEVFSFAFDAVINPRFRSAVSGNETLAELMLDSVDYASFRTRCHELSRARFAEHLLVQAVVVNTLAWAQSFADPAQVESTIKRNEAAMEYFAAELETESDQQRRETLGRMVESQRRHIEEAPARQQTWARYYRVLCESVLPRLALEKNMPWGDSLG